MKEGDENFLEGTTILVGGECLIYFFSLHGVTQVKNVIQCRQSR